jgi:hypothetical protein
MFTEKQIINININLKSIAQSIINLVSKFDKSNKVIAEFVNIELTDEIKNGLTEIFFNNDNNAMRYKAYEKYSHNKQTVYKYILIYYMTTKGIYIIKQTQLNGTYEFVYYKTIDSIIMNIKNKFHNNNYSEAHNIFSCIKIDDTVQNKLSSFSSDFVDTILKSVTIIEYKIHNNILKKNNFFITYKDKTYKIIYIEDDKFYMLWISEIYIIKPIFIKNFIPKHSYYTLDYINYISTDTYKIVNEIINKFISNYLKENIIMRDKPYTNIIINEDIKMYIRDFLFTKFNLHKIYGYEKIICHDIEMYKHILIVYRNDVQSNIIWILKKSIDSNLIEVVFYVDITFLLINSINKVVSILPEDTFENFTVKWDKEFINNYNLPPYDTIMKEVNTFEQSINKQMIDNYDLRKTFSIKPICHNTNNNIMNFNIIIYDKYKYWLLVCNNKKILRPYFLRDFIPNVD